MRLSKTKWGSLHLPLLFQDEKLVLEAESCKKTQLSAIKCVKFCLFLERFSQLNVLCMCSSLEEAQENLDKCIL